MSSSGELNALFVVLPDCGVRSGVLPDWSCIDESLDVLPSSWLARGERVGGERTSEAARSKRGAGGADDAFEWGVPDVCGDECATSGSRIGVPDSAGSDISGFVGPSSSEYADETELPGVALRNSIVGACSLLRGPCAIAPERFDAGMAGASAGCEKSRRSGVRGEAGDVVLFKRTAGMGEENERLASGMLCSGACGGKVSVAWDPGFTRRGRDGSEDESGVDVCTLRAVSGTMDSGDIDTSTVSCA